MNEQRAGRLFGARGARDRPCAPAGWKSFFLIGVGGGGLVFRLAAGRGVGHGSYGWLGRDFPHHAALATGIGLTVAGS